MTIGLERVPGIEEQHETAYHVRALLWNGGSLALDSLAEWQRRQPMDYKQIMAGLRYVAGTKQPWENLGRVRANGVPEPAHARGAPQDHKIYEVKALKEHARILFYLAPGTPETIVLLCGFWKKRDRDPEQRRAFERAQTLRNHAFDEVNALLRQSWPAQGRKDGGPR